MIHVRSWLRRSSHCDCCLDNILELSDGFEEDLVPVDSQVRCIIADEPDVELGVAGRPDTADNVVEPLDLLHLPDRLSAVQSSWEDICPSRRGSRGELLLLAGTRLEWLTIFSHSLFIVSMRTLP